MTDAEKLQWLFDIAQITRLEVDVKALSPYDEGSARQRVLGEPA